MTMVTVSSQPPFFIFAETAIRYSQYGRCRRAPGPL
jgi:hypothetical protein